MINWALRNVKMSFESMCRSKSLCLFMEPLEIMFPELRGGGHTDFGIDPVGVGIIVTLSCLHNILWTSGWILTKFSWIYNWDIKNWLDFGDNLICKVIAVEKLKIHCEGTSDFSENIVTSFGMCGVVRWCEGVVYLTSPGCPPDIGFHLGKACYLCSR